MIAKIDGAGYSLPAESTSFSREHEKLLEMLLKEYLSESPESSGDAVRIQTRLKAILARLSEDYGVEVEKNAGSALVDVAFKNVSGFGVFDYLLADDELEEISVVGVNKPVYVFHKTRGWLKTNCVLTSEAFAVNTINKMARALGRRITYQNPRLNAMLPNGARLHACISPLTLNGVELTIRKFREKPFTILDLINFNTLDANLAAFLWLAAYADASILVAGNTGSGKTTFLNALFSFIPLSDRVVVTEETPEIRIPHEHQVRIVANEELDIPLRAVVKDTLRMRPDRVIIGEVRDASEAQALFDSLLAGQARGSYATFHAGSAREALARLTAFGARPEDLNAIDLLVILRRATIYDKKAKKQREVRRVVEVAEVVDGAPVKLFEFDAAAAGGGCLRATRAFSSLRFFNKIAFNYGFRNFKEFEGELELRSRFLKNLNGKQLDLLEFTNAVNAYLFSHGKTAEKNV